MIMWEKKAIVPKVSIKTFCVQVHFKNYSLLEIKIFQIHISDLVLCDNEAPQERLYIFHIHSVYHENEWINFK